ncbi:winged helix-turn-helix domain-containing protein [Streptomyces sp. AS02]|uniref:winged helix-turn-helix transcriptional regulator n=1 Tax=Streptomyces sp. AS02 TaxID=2938946 RepID=UPI0020215719|nr:winged helix-turn-helix domain-containing protein [Streptomyces sp. AS02]MCL8011471.1 winged helix-turn-helix domain-containing protein [Streptomyces sp. AS02]
MRDVRSENRFEVLHALLELGPSSRQELARHTGLSLATVTTLVGKFLAEGVLRIAAVERTAVGRPYERLTINPDRGRIVGVDVAETYVDATVYDLALDVVLDGIVGAIEAALKASGTGREGIMGVGVSTPATSSTTPGSPSSRPTGTGTTSTSRNCSPSGCGCRWRAP